MIKDFARRLGVVPVGVTCVTVLCLGASAAPRQEEAVGAAPARAVVAKREPKRPDSRKPEAEGEETKAAGKPEQVGTFGDWRAFVAQGAKDKTCYALAQPKQRAPAGLSRDPAYVFISTRPGEKVREEVSIIVGFPMKEDGGSKAVVGGVSFDLVVKAQNAWIKNQVEEAKLVEAMKQGSQLVVSARSTRGRMTTDTYSLAGVTQALEKAAKACQ
jgi:hypothetical protein